MTWGKMDDKFHRNKKVRKLRRMPQGYAALGLWAFWWSWCLDSPDLDGVIPDEELDDKGRKLADLLCSDLHEGRGLWVRVKDGYQIHDFHQYNPTKKQVEDKRAADRDRMASKRGAAPRDDGDSGASREEVASDSPATGVRVASTRVPIPSHPIPDPPLPPEGGNSDTAPADERESAGVYLTAVQGGWADAYFAANAGTAPRLAPGAMRAAVAFARDVAGRHGLEIRDAAKAIAAGALIKYREEKDRKWALSSLDPFAALPANQQAEFIPYGQPGSTETWDEMKTRKAAEMAERNRKAGA